MPILPYIINREKFLFDCVNPRIGNVLDKRLANGNTNLINPLKIN
jgi:hypothetical protein